MDKDGAALPAWPALGFGFVEVGTVTAHAQPGNPRPRLFRLPASEAVVNRMGFNNAGAAALAARLAALPRPLGVPLGISLGKSKVTPLDEAVEDYLASLPGAARARRLLRGQRLLAEHPGAALVAGPGAPGRAARRALVGEKPVLVKIAPDLTEAAIAELLEVCLARGAAGVIATNTTLARDGLAPADAGARRAGRRPVRSPADRPGPRGGRLRAPGDRRPAADHRRRRHRWTRTTRRRMFDAGAALVQLYTGFIYRGPALVRAAARRRHRSWHRSGPRGSADRPVRTDRWHAEHRGSPVPAARGRRGR